MGIKGLKNNNPYKVNCDYHRVLFAKFSHGGKVEISVASFQTREDAGTDVQPIRTTNYATTLDKIPQRVDFREAVYAFVMEQPEWSESEVVLEEDQVLEA